MDELLISVETLEACKATSDGMLGTLRDLGHRVPAKKAQLCQTKETYLGHILKGGQMMTVKCKERDSSEDIQTQKPLSCERISEDCWVIKAPDTWICRLSLASV